jgi:hypothetical protein
MYISPMSARSALKNKFLALAAFFLFSFTAKAIPTNSMTLTIDASDPGSAIPANFIGLSISSSSIDGNSGYTKFLTTADTQMINLFKQIGIKHLRTIMNKGQPGFPDPSNSQIDSFFDFAAAAGVNKIIWSLHLYNAEIVTNWANNAVVAAHIWSTTTAKGTVESNLLDSFAFDNEPDWLRYICCADSNVTGYDTPASTGGYNSLWNTWQQTITTIAPGAKFSGPDTGSKWPCPGEINTSVNGVPFTLRFATDESGIISTATQHFYGQTPIAGFSALQLAEACLSSNWLNTNYSIINSKIVGSLTVPYRFTECSAFDNETNSGNLCFATGLWALDFYHWFARHGCAGVNPFTRTAQYDSPIFYDGANYIAEPYAYAMKAFNLGGSGNVIYTSKFLINNPDNINVTAYGVVNSSDLYVTVINKTFNEAGACAAHVTIPAPTGFAVVNARYMVMSGGPTPGGYGNATVTGACLGGAEITNNTSSWTGAWMPLPVSGGGVNLTVLPTTAVVIDLQNYPALTLGSPPLDGTGFHLSAFAPGGSNAVVQISTNLLNWNAVYTNSGAFTFIDSNATNGKSYFYRLVMQ